MRYLEIMRLKKKLDNQLTPRFAHKLLSEMPSGDQSLYYDAWYGKFFKHDEFGGLIAWSVTMGKWILWLHEKNYKSVHWEINHIQTIARQYQYQIGDQVLYCGIGYDSDSCIYSVVGFDSQGKVVVSDGKNKYGGFFMDNWRLASIGEESLGRRLFVGKDTK